MRRHDELMRTAIGMRDGYVSKTIGDAFSAAFARPEDAVGAALDAQRSLGAEDFPRSTASASAWRCIRGPPTSATATTSAPQ